MDQDQKTAIVAQALADYTANRLVFYDKVTIEDLLKKDMLLFLLKGAADSSSFVGFAFSALESSSEEGVMGNVAAGILKALAGGTNIVDAGDLMAERDGCLWIVEIKSQENTMNARSLAATVRNLKARVQQHAAYHVGRRRPVRALIGILRGPSRDCDLTYRASPGQPENQDLDGFRYRYLVGSALWSWATGSPSLPELLVDLKLQIPMEEWSSAIRDARGRAIARLVEDCQSLLLSRGLEDDIGGLISLWGQYHSGGSRLGTRQSQCIE